MNTFIEIVILTFILCAKSDYLKPFRSLETVTLESCEIIESDLTF